MLNRCENCNIETSQKIEENYTDLASSDYVFVANKPLLIDIRNEDLYASKGGALLKNVINQVGIMEESYLTKMMICRPQNAKPTEENYTHCMQRIRESLKLTDLKAIVTLGTRATNYFLENEESISKLRQRVYYSEEFDCKIVPTYHPAYVKDKPNLFRYMTQDISKLKGINDYPELDTKFDTITTVNRAIKAVKWLRENCNWLVGDIETSGFDFRKDKIGEIGVGFKVGQSLIFGEEILDNIRVKRELTKLFEDESISWMWVNGKFDIKFFRYQWDCRARVDEDMMLKDYTIDHRFSHSLIGMSKRLLNAKDYEKEFKQHIPRAEDGSGLAYLEAPRGMLREYLSKDVDYPKRLDDRLDPQMDEEMRNVYENILIPASNELADIEIQGIHIDAEHLEEIESKYSVLVDEALEKLQDKAREVGFIPQEYCEGYGSNSQPDNYNPSSWQQSRYLFFGLLCLPRYDELSTGVDVIEWWIRMLKSDYKFNKFLSEAVDDVRDAQRIKNTNKNLNWVLQVPKSQVEEYIKNKWEEYDIVGLLEKMLEYRDLSKLYSTYIKGFQEQLTEENKVHTNFKLHITDTGRLSSSNPNIQNIPRNKEIKHLFTVPEGYTLMECDYSQAELRTLAYFSQDPFLLDIYYNDKDLHDQVTEQLFGEDWTNEDRQKSKAVNFGIAYGLKAWSLARDLEVSVEEAEDIMDKWKSNASVAWEWIQNTRKLPQEQGYTKTPLGRYRWFGLVTEKNKNFRQNAGVNTPIQSTASDMTLLSTIQVVRALRGSHLDSKVVNTVHDSILLQVPDEQVQETAKFVKDIMEEVPANQLDTDIPFKVDVEIGSHWDKIEEIEVNLGWK